MDAVELDSQSGSESNPRLNKECPDGASCFRMPANSNAIGAKKPRKKPRPPQMIAPEVWVAIEKAIVAGMGYSEAARISAFALLTRLSCGPSARSGPCQAGLKSVPGSYKPRYRGAAKLPNSAQWQRCKRRRASPNLGRSMAKRTAVSFTA